MTVDSEWESLQADSMMVDDWDLDTAFTFIRAAYGKGYVYGLEQPDPDPAVARLVEREAWAKLPVP